MYKENIDMSGRVILITGGTSGLGKQCALKFFGLGANVIFTGRSLKKGGYVKNYILKKHKKIAKENLEFYQCNFGDLDHIKTLSESIQAKKGRLDCILNNVGTHLLKKETTSYGNDMLVQVNYLSAFYQTDLLFGLQAKTKNSRVVNVTCDAYNDINYQPKFNQEDFNIEKRDYHWYKNYCETKLYNVLFTIAMAKFCDEAKVDLTEQEKYKDLSVKVLLCNPGLSRTSLWNKLPNSAKRMIKIQWIFIVFMTKKAIYGSQTQFKLCMSDWSELSNGGYYYNLKLNSMGTQANSEDADQLWDFTIDLLEEQVGQLNAFRKFNKE